MHIRHVATVIGLTLAASGAAGSPRHPAPPRVVVLSIALNNLTPQEDPAERANLALLTRALRRRLAEACGYTVVAVDSTAEEGARLGDGYLYSHPDAAAALAATAGADWVLVPRFNRASPWVADLQAHVVRASTGDVVSNRVVELKGFGLSPELTARITERGAAWMADQVDQAIGWAERPKAPVARRCPA